MTDKDSASHKCTTHLCSHDHIEKCLPWKINWHFLKSLWRRSQIPVPPFPLPFPERHYTHWLLSLVAPDQYKMPGLTYEVWLRLLDKRTKSWSWLLHKSLLCDLMKRLLSQESGNQRYLVRLIYLQPSDFSTSLKSKVYEFTYLLDWISYHSWASTIRFTSLNLNFLIKWRNYLHHVT